MIAFEYLAALIFFGIVTVPLYRYVKKQNVRDAQLKKARQEKVDAEKALEVERLREQTEKAKREAEAIRDKSIQDILREK